MRRLFRSLESPILAVLLLFIFAISMATATFIENDFGTSTAWKVIYNAWWFEFVMFGLGVSFLFNINKYKLWRKEKWAILLFHLAFIVILLGAAITRYTANGGVMRIREGHSSNLVISDKNYLQILVSDGTKTRTVRKQVDFSPISNNGFEIETSLHDQPVSIFFQQFVADAIPQVKDNAEGGKSLFQLVVSSGNGRETVFLEKGEVERIGSGNHQHEIGFEAEKEGIINIREHEGTFQIFTPRQLDYFVMASQAAGNIPKDSLQEFSLKTLYRDGDVSFVPLSFHPNATIELISQSEKPKDNDKAKDDALVLNITVGDTSKNISLLYREGFLPTLHEWKVNNLSIQLSYGSEPIELPFALKLNDFQLERYPGSTSPSAYASEVTILDGDIQKPYRIFMNNVLDYKGYRFYQASYDTDELGTVLSVNQDRLGTWLTYIGYFLMSLGMFFTLFGKASRFQLINQELKRLKQAKAMLLLFCCLIANTSHAKPDPKPELTLIAQQEIDVQHADLFGRLMVQDLDGRIKPINTLASEFLRKISRKPYFKYTADGKHKRLNANQVFLAMHVNPSIWQEIPIIKVDLEKGGALFSNLSVNENSLVAFNTFINKDGDYLLAEAVEKANLKKPAERNELDKEVIKVDERFNVLYNVMLGNYLKIFPNSLDQNNTWFSYTHTFEDFTEENGQFVQTIIPSYFQDIRHHKWQEATDKLSYIKTYQDVLGKNIIPSDRRIAAELWYNEINLNFWLFQVYFTLGLALLVFAIVRIFKQSKLINFTWNSLIIVTLLSFILFTGNLVLRWYVAQHAPWSNGYEMLIFVTWVLMFCGLIAFRKSDFALPLATLFSGALLFVSYLDWLNPEITNLMPVLKSYWLKIHVATIVSSYAPLALSAVLGLMALILMIVKTDKTQKVIDIRIRELSYINEISMTIGLFVLAIGTFLGGVWANESWGRYWAWDPKETWALISIIVYAIVLHLRFIPKLQNRYVLNVASMFAFWSIIMTSFGVNYYLSGLHSYAAGDPLPIPNFIYILAGTMLVIAAVAYFREVKSKSTSRAQLS